MILVLTRLLLMSLRGRVVRSLRMLQQPKYLIGSVIGGGWVLFWVARSTQGLRFGRWAGLDSMFEPERLAGLQVLASVAVALAASVMWLVPWGKLGLGLKEAELHVLLPAPISRRQIIQYAVLKNQVGLVITAAVLSVFLGSGTTGERLLGFGGLWAVFNVWDLNGKLRSMFLLRQREIPRGSALGRRLLLTGVVLAFWAVVLPSLLDAGSRALVVLRDANVSVAGFSRALSMLHEGVAANRVSAGLLQPFAWMVGPLFTREPGRFLLALLPIAAVAFFQLELIVRSPARFEETSLERAEKETRAKSPARALANLSARARRRQPFVLWPEGHPEVAIVWKNTLAVLRRPVRQAAVFAMVVVALIVVVLPLAGAPSLVFGLIALAGLIGFVLFPFTAGIFWQNDFRSELRNVELVRTWPVSAERFVLAEILSPALLSVLAAAAGAGLILASLAGAMVAESLAGSRQLLLPEQGTAILGVRYALAVPLMLAGAMPFVVGLATVSSALQNLVVLFVPAWIAQGSDATKGMAAFGHRLLFASALGLAFFFAMIPSTLVVLAAVGVQWLVGIPWSAWAFPVWGLLAAAPLLLGAYMILRAAAELWERLDPAEELLETAG